MKNIKIYGILCILLIIIIGAVYINNSSVRKENIENEARASQKIPTNFEVSIGETKDIVAMLFYDKGEGRHIFSVYTKNNGILKRYSFKYGGGLGEIEEGVASFNIGESKDRIYLSMNKDRIEKIKLSNGRTINVDSTKPFSIIDENATEDVLFYDVNGNIVEGKKNF